MIRNPYLVALLAVGGFALVLAFMLWNVVVQITDYTEYVVVVGRQEWWISVLTMTGIATFAAAVALAGAEWRIRLADRDGTAAGRSRVSDLR